MRSSLTKVIVHKLTNRTLLFIERMRIERIRSRRYCSDETPYPFASR